MFTQFRLAVAKISHHIQIYQIIKLFTSNEIINKSASCDHWYIFVEYNKWYTNGDNSENNNNGNDNNKDSNETSATT